MAVWCLDRRKFTSTQISVNLRYNVILNPGKKLNLISSIFSRHVDKPPIMILAPAIGIGLVMLLPLTYLIIRSLDASEATWELLFRFRTLVTLGRTVLLIFTVTLTSILISVPLAWLTTRTNLPLHRMWAVITVLPLVIPSFVGGYLFISALGPRGLLQQALSPIGVDRLPEIYGLPGATLTLSLLSYPYILLTIRGALRNLDPALEESARALGYGAFKTFVKVALPQLRPAITAGSLLIALYTLSDFGAVSLMRYKTFTWVIFQQYESSLDRSLIALVSLIVAMIAIATVLIDIYTRGKLRYHSIGPGAARSPAKRNLQGWKWPALAFMTSIATVSIVVPASILWYWLIRGISAGEPVSIIWRATWNSISVSMLAAVTTSVLCIPLAILIVRYPSRLASLIERVSYIGFALPGVVVAISLVFFAANYAQPIYQTIWLLILAYVVLFFPTALGATRASLLQINPHLEEAAHSLGYTSLKAIRSVTVPLAGPGVVMGGSIVFLIAMKELPATMILGSLGFSTLATSVWAAASEAFFAQAALPALVLIAVSSVPMAFLVAREKGEFS